MTNAFPAHLQRSPTARRLSQLELAVRAGTTQRHLSFIEQGRSRPGPGVVASRVGNMPEWGRHVTANLHARLVRTPDPSLHLEAFVPADEDTADVLRKRAERW